MRSETILLAEDEAAVRSCGTHAHRAYTQMEGRGELFHPPELKVTMAR
jgi:hypothetical protein